MSKMIVGDEEESTAFLPMSLEDKSISRFYSGDSFLAQAKRLWTFLLPSPLRHVVQQKDQGVLEKAAPEKHRPTDYLDGLRGVASLCVFISHWSATVHPELNSGYGYDDNWGFMQLPVIRIVHSGAAMVAIFFVVSGYVLTHRCIVHMRNGTFDGLLSALTSMTFRRAMRLFIPSFVSSFIAFTCAELGFVKIPKGFEVGIPTYMAYLNAYSTPWTWDINFTGFYNPHLWTIPVEFRCSLVLFLLCIGLAKTRTSFRLLIEIALIVYCFLHLRWDVALFISGMLLAETNILYDVYIKQTAMIPAAWNVETAGLPPKRKSSVKSALFNCLLVFNLFLGVFLACYPRDGASQSPGYVTLSSMWPAPYSEKRRFWHGMGAMLLVSSISFMPKCQAVFITRPARYLGKISYALYLVHGITNRTAGRVLRNKVWAMTGREEWPQINKGWFITSLIYVPFVFWCADVFWRAIDLPAVNFARRVENFFTVKGRITRSL